MQRLETKTSRYVPYAFLISRGKAGVLIRGSMQGAVRRAQIVHQPSFKKRLPPPDYCTDQPAPPRFEFHPPPPMAGTAAPSAASSPPLSNGHAAGPIASPTGKPQIPHWDDFGACNSPGSAVHMLKQRRKKRKDENLLAAMCAWIVDHQIGIAINFGILLFLTHICFPKARSLTTAFFQLSYYDPETQRYTQGPDDFFFVASWIFVFTGLRAGVLTYVLLPFAQSQGITSLKKKVRFAEQAWLLLYYSVFWPLGMYIMYHTDYWFNLKEMWAHFPARSMDGLLKWYYLVQFAFWIQQIVVVNIEERRKDHWQMFTHHIVTCALLLFSYGYYQTKVGNVILVLMDCVDLTLPAAKMLKYLGYQMACDIAFGIFIVSWFMARHVAYMMVCWSIYADVNVYTMFYGCFSSVDGTVLNSSALAAVPEDQKNGILSNVLQPFTNPGAPVCFNPRNAEIAGARELPPLEKEVGVEGLSFQSRNGSNTRLRKAAAGRGEARTGPNGLSMAGHGGPLHMGDRKELLGRIGPSCWRRWGAASWVGASATKMAYNLRFHLARVSNGYLWEDNLKATMEDYSQSVCEEFFRELDGLSQDQCKDFVHTSIASAVYGPAIDQVSVITSTFQGSMSYTCVLENTGGIKTIVQFRNQKQDTTGIDEAHRLFGNQAPAVTSHGPFKSLWVYTSPFVTGAPFIGALMSPSSSLGLTEKTTTARELAHFCTGGARPAAEQNLASALDSIQIQLSKHDFKDTELHDKTLRVVDKLRSDASTFATLPHILGHQDLSPFNYLVDDVGHITAVLDWDGAAYEPVGTNFHFVDNVFGNMTPKGWVDGEDRAELEDAFYTRVLQLLASQGFPDVSRAQLQRQKAFGVLRYWVPRLHDWPGPRTEQYLGGYVERMSFV
ncbi:hypothetical protein FH972_025422 [Carpinus fangiana]|uniref:TLC domain-containing protein n=1 Tax=Carpinus fangiana TaxID=176857 RepID=A0A5N6L0Z6_9ROSI|nr:hypothetical protein FH972_025422 [Carpinus fangiana]